MSDPVGVLTERDVEWLAWVGRWRGVTAGQLGEWWLPESSSRVQIAERRARVWLSMGLTKAEPVLANVARLHNLRAAGMRVASVEGAVRHVNVGTARHDLAVVDLATWWHHRGEQIVTEREIRAAEGAGDARPVMSLVAVPGAGRQRLFPDLLTVEPSTVEGRPRFTAHEVELAPKPTARLVALMTSYGSSERHERVIYYVPDSYRSRVDKAARAANEIITGRWSNAPKVFVKPWVWGRQ